MNASEQKNTDLVEKFSTFDFQLFAFLERFMISVFLITLTQLEKTGSIGKVFISLEI